MTFAAGVSGNPAGRPRKGPQGRARAIGLLDRILGKHSNIKLLADALQASFQKNPIRFFDKFGVALMPKSSRVELSGTVLDTAAIAEQLALMGLSTMPVAPPDPPAALPTAAPGPAAPSVPPPPPAAAPTPPVPATVSGGGIGAEGGPA